MIISQALMTPLMYAVSMENEGYVRVLLNFGANQSLKNLVGELFLRILTNFSVLEKQVCLRSRNS
jgi:ankyrin repeat protein